MQVRDLRRFAIRLSGSALLLILLFVFLPAQSLWAGIQKVPVRMFALVLCCYLATHFLAALKWNFVLSVAGASLPTVQALRCYYAGLFGNTFLPSIIGGDLVSVGLAMRGSSNRAEILFASMTNRILDIAALLGMAMLGACLLPQALTLQGQKLLRITTVILLAGILACLVLLAAFRLLRYSFRTRRQLVKLRRAVRIAWQQRLRMLLAFGMSLAIQGCFLGATAWIGHACGLNLGLNLWLFAWSLAKFAAFLPVTQSGIGVREFAFAGALAPFGVPPASAVTVCLLWEAFVVGGGLTAGAISLMFGRLASSHNNSLSKNTLLSLQRVLFWGVPIVTMCFAFLGLCLDAGTLWPWSSVVHEDGQRTLLRTIFYFEHATRELPLDVLLGAAVAGSVLLFYPRRHVRVPGAAAGHARSLHWTLGLCAVTTAVVVLGTVIEQGWNSTMLNLLQFHTRSGTPLVYGSHWRYHLLAQLALIFSAFFIVGLQAMLSSAATRSAILASSKVFLSTLFVFAVLTVFFGLRSDSFVDSRYLGHQARELFTHGLVTLPLAIGACLQVALRNTPVAESSGARSPVRLICAAGAISAMLALYLAIGVVWTGSQGHAQTTNVVRLIFAHFFEHSFTYLIVAGYAAGLYWLAAVRAPAAPRERNSR